jgi:hypothetical protein
MDSSTASDDIPYCWCNADPTLVHSKSNPSPKSSLLKVYDWPDSRERRMNRSAAFPYRIATDIIHKDCKGMIRQRGLYWWLSEQIKLEDKIVAGTIQPVIGAFYCFLEEEHCPGYDVLGKPMPGVDTSKPVTTVIFRYGNVFSFDPNEGYYWTTLAVAFPKGHPDADAPPYKMIDVIDRSLP